MATVPTGKMEQELKRLYLLWVREIPTDPTKLKSHIARFLKQVDSVVAKHGGEAVRTGHKLGFPDPRKVDYSEKLSDVKSDFTNAIIRAGMHLGQNAGTIASALDMANVGDTAFYKLQRTARTEVVKAYWENQWRAAEGLDLVLVWSAENGSRTCYQCLARDGLVVKHKNVRDHPNGRCTLRAEFPETLGIRSKSPNPRFNRTEWSGDARHLFDAPGMQEYRRLFSGTTPQVLVGDVRVQRAVTAMVSQGWTSAQAALYVRKGSTLPDLDQHQYSTLLRVIEGHAQTVWEGLQPGTETTTMYRGGDPVLPTGLYSWTPLRKVAELYAVRNGLKGSKVIKEATVPKEVLRYSLTEANPQQQEFLLMGEMNIHSAEQSGAYTIQKGSLTSPVEYLPFSKEISQ